MKPFDLMLLCGLSLGVATTAATAQSWPTKPLRVIIPVAAGGATDIIPRIVLEQLSAQVGQPIIVENRPGAGTTIGANTVAKSDPDGYTILVNGPSHTIAPSLYPKLPYHPLQDFAAVTPFGVSRSVLVVSPDKGLKTARDLVAAAKAKPGGFNFSSVGAGTATHLSAERFRASAGVDAVHVPFKGGAEAMMEVIAGRIDFFFGPLGLVLPNIRDGKLVALAVNGSERAPALPNVLTLAEAGFAQRRVPVLARHVRAGPDAAQHRRAASQRNAQGAASAQSTRQADRARFRPDIHDPGGLRGVCREGDFQGRSAGQGNRAEGAVALARRTNAECGRSVRAAAASQEAA